MKENKELSDKIISIIVPIDIKYRGFFKVIGLEKLKSEYVIEGLILKDDIESLEIARRKLVYYLIDNLAESTNNTEIYYNQYFDFEEHKLAMQLWTQEL